MGWDPRPVPKRRQLTVNCLFCPTIIKTSIKLGERGQLRIRLARQDKVLKIDTLMSSSANVLPRLSDH